LPEIYVPYWQWPMQNPTVLIRMIGGTAPLSAVIRRETKAVAPNLPPPIIRTMSALISDAVARPRLQTFLLSLFGGVALVLTALGLYGMVAWSVSQRTRELGIRMALGAQQSDLVRMVVRQGIIPATIGVGVGVTAAFGLSQIVTSQVYEISAAAPATLGAVSVGLLLVALLAAWLPARRAAKVDPMEALRSE
jgi:putative ABC transport system permease protein